MRDELTPSRIVQELDKYIIGQKDAKRAVAIALRNRWRRMHAKPELRAEIMPNNILMIGSTGVGKTEIARRLAGLADAPFIKVEASKFTEVGYVGRDVESMVRDLVEQAVNMVREQHVQSVREKAEANAIEIILNELLPPVKGPTSKPTSTWEPTDDQNSGEDEDEDEDDIIEREPQKDTAKPTPETGVEELNERTRARMREKIKNGDFDHRKIDIRVAVPTHTVHVATPMGMEGMEGLQDFLSNMVPKKKRNRTMTVAEAREYLLEQESQKLLDMDNVAREAIDKAQNSGIIFIDEIDKIASGAGRSGGPDVSREGVQRDLLPIIEGSVVNTKHGSIKTDHILFIAAGAFHVSKPSDLIPELQGRLPIRVELSPLSQEDFVKILTQPRNALTAQYQALLETENVNISFEPDAIEELAQIAFQVNQEVENIGARRLHTIMSNLLDEILFTVPDQNSSQTFIITREFVNQKLSSLVRSRNLSHYIL
jgi:ATP-dependent HslUV protease ATP-binding subunit HslU